MHRPANLGKPRTVVAMFRDPLQRLLSAFHEGRRIETNSGRGWDKERMKVMIAAMDKLKDQSEDSRFHFYVNWPHLRGCATKMVMGFHCNAEHNITAGDVVEAQRRIREDFAFVGLLEHYDDSVCLFHQMFGHSLWLPIESGHDRQGRQHSTKSSAGLYEGTDISKFGSEGVDPWDQEIYDTAHEVFTANLRQYSACPVQTRTSCADVDSGGDLLLPKLQQERGSGCDFAAG